MSISKKFYSLVLAILAVFALVGCNMGGNGGNTNDPEPVEGITLSDAQALVNKAIAKIGWAETDLEVVGDLTFATSNSFAPGVVISWASSNEAVIGVDGKVTRPEYGQGDATVTITATYSIAYNLDDNGNTVDEVYSDTESWTFVVKEAGEVFNIAKLEAQMVAGEIEAGAEATITGVIVAKMASNQGNQIFVHDGSAGIYVYTASDLAVGTEVQVSGTVDVYYEIFQIKNAGITVVSENAQLPEATKTTLGEHMAKGKDSGKIGGELINVDVLLEIVTEQYTNVYITDPKTGDKARVYYKTEYTYIPGYNGETDYMAALQPYNGKTINITLVQYDIKDGEGHRLMLTSYPITEVAAVELTDEEKAEFILNGINIPTTVTTALTLPAEEGLTWAVKEGNGITIAEGVATVAPTTEVQTVVLTATATVNQVVLTKDFTISVAAQLPEPTQTTIADLVANKPTAEKAEIFVVTGIWTLDAGKETYGNGKLADEAGNTIVIYGLCKDDSVVSYDGTAYTYSNNKSYASIGLNDGAVIKVGMLYTPKFDNYSAYIIEIVSAGEAPAHEHVACPTCGLCTAADCDGAEEVKCAGHQDTPVVPGTEALIDATIAGSLPNSVTYITNNASYPDAAFYSDGGLKFNFVNQGISTVAFTAQTAVKVTLVVKALNENTKSNTDAPAFTVYALNAEGATVATATVDPTAAGEFVVVLAGEGIVSVKVMFTDYANNGNKACNVSLSGLKVEVNAGSDTPVDPEVPAHTHVACPTCGLCTAADCDGAAEVKCAGHQDTPVVPEDGALIDATIAGSLPSSVTYITNNASYPDAAFYSDGGLKFNFVNQGISTVAFTAQTAVKVTLVVKALNENTKSNTDAPAFTVYALNAEGATVATATVDPTAAGEFVVVLAGEGIVSVKVMFTDYANNGNKACNVSLSGLKVEVNAGSDTPVVPEVPAHEHVACPTCGLCTAADCDGAEEVKCAGHVVEPEVPAHEHVACATCGLCTAADCDGAEEVKCAGHEATEEPAAPAEITITFEGDNRVSQDSEAQVWAVDGLKITNAKAASTQPIADYVNPARFYANTSLTFESTTSAKITKIVITTTGGKNFSASQAVEGATITVDGTTTTIVLDTPATSFTIAKIAAQVRVSQMVVYTE